MCLLWRTDLQDLNEYNQMIHLCIIFVHFYSSGPASKSSARTPCTNRLIFCPSCDEILWSYNVGLHYDKFHLGIDSAIFENLVASRAELQAVLNFGVKLRRDKNTNITDFGNV